MSISIFKMISIIVEKPYRVALLYFVDTRHQEKERAAWPDRRRRSVSQLHCLKLDHYTHIRLSPHFTSLSQVGQHTSRVSLELCV